MNTAKVIPIAAFAVLFGIAFVWSSNVREGPQAQVYERTQAYIQAVRDSADGRVERFFLPFVIEGSGPQLRDPQLKHASVLRDYVTVIASIETVAQGRERVIVGVVDPASGGIVDVDVALIWARHTDGEWYLMP